MAEKKLGTIRSRGKGKDKGNKKREGGRGVEKEEERGNWGRGDWKQEEEARPREPRRESEVSTFPEYRPAAHPFENFRITSRHALARHEYYFEREREGAWDKRKRSRSA